MRRERSRFCRSDWLVCRNHWRWPRSRSSFPSPQRARFSTTLRWSRWWFRRLGISLGARACRVQNCSWAWATSHCSSARSRSSEHLWTWSSRVWFQTQSRRVNCPQWDRSGFSILRGSACPLWLRVSLTWCWSVRVCWRTKPPVRPVSKSARTEASSGSKIRDWTRRHSSRQDWHARSVSLSNQLPETARQWNHRPRWR